MGRTVISIGDFGKTVDDNGFLTKHYLNMKVAKLGQSLWDFDDKLLKMIGESVEVIDMVNHEYKI